MQNPVIHDPHLKATPSQHLAAAAHRERLAKIAANAKPDIPLSCLKPLPVSEIKQLPPSPNFDFDKWLKRQETINPLPKEPWFSIEAELDPPEPIRPKIEDIQRAVSRFSQISRTDMVSARRTAAPVRARQIAMYLSKTLTLRSLPEIGRRFGKRDHTTVLHAVRKIARLIAGDETLAAEIETLKASILEAT